MTNSQKYKLSFTSVPLRLIEMVKIAKYAVENDITDFSLVKDSGIVYGSLKNSTLKRHFRELRNRLEKLTPDQLQILINGDLNSQKQVAFLAVCKYYDFIRDFAIDVIRDKSLVYDYKINESDYNSFINNRIHFHPELEMFKDSTMKKAKQVAYQPPFPESEYLDRGD